MARLTFYLLVVILCVVFNHGFTKHIKNQLSEEMDQQAPEIRSIDDQFKLSDEEILKFNDVNSDDDDNDDGEFSDDFFGNKGKTGLKDSINSLPILSSSLSEDKIAKDKDVKDFKDGENSIDKPDDSLKNDELLQHPYGKRVERFTGIPVGEFHKSRKRARKILRSDVDPGQAMKEQAKSGFDVKKWVWVPVDGIDGYAAA